MRLVLDGEIASERSTRAAPNFIQDVYALLGCSAYSEDPPLRGALLEFRIYDRALDADTLRRLFEAGPDALE